MRTRGLTRLRVLPAARFPSEVVEPHAREWLPAPAALQFPVAATRRGIATSSLSSYTRSTAQTRPRPLRSAALPRNCFEDQPIRGFPVPWRCDADNPFQDRFEIPGESAQPRLPLRPAPSP